MDDFSLDDLSLNDLLSIERVAAHLGTSTEDVEKRTRRGELLRVRFGAARREPRYPAFQFLAELCGPVQKCLQLLAPEEAYLYLGFIHSDMAGLTPLEVLLGRAIGVRQLSEEALAILAMGAGERLDFALVWAQAFRDQSSGW